MNDDEGYKEIAEEVGGKFMKNRDQNELKLIKNFITKINNGTINDKDKATNGFRELKKKVNDQILKQELIKYLENTYLEKILKIHQKKIILQKLMNI